MTCVVFSKLKSSSVASNFHELWPASKFNWRILNIWWHLGCAKSRQSYL